MTHRDLEPCCMYTVPLYKRHSCMIYELSVAQVIDLKTFLGTLPLYVLAVLDFNYIGESGFDIFLKISSMYG